MTEFNILLFAPHLPSHGVRARAAFWQDTLIIDGRRVPVSLNEIGVTLGGFNHDQVFLFWHQEESRWAFSPADENAWVQLRSSAPSPLSDWLKSATKEISRQQHRSRFGLGMLGLFLVLPLLLLVLFIWQSHYFADWVASRISIENEQKLGELAFKQATLGMRLRQSGSDAAAVKEIGARLTKGSKYAYRWYVAEDPSINAFAVPGGYVVVNTGLIQAADSAEEVAGVLAHEVQHIELRHTLKNLIHSLGLRAMLALALGDVSGSGLGVAATLTELKFSRDLESEADRKGLAALKQAGISPQGMVTFFSKLHQLEKGTSLPTLLSTHPASEDRMQTLQELIRQQSPWASSPLPYDWATIKSSSSKR